MKLFNFKYCEPLGYPCFRKPIQYHNGHWLCKKHLAEQYTRHIEKHGKWFDCEEMFKDDPRAD